MKIDRYTKLILTLIAIALCVIAFERTPPQSAAAAEPSSPNAAPALLDAEFVSAADTRFVMINRHTGDFALYELTAPHNEWKWQQFGPTGHLAPLKAAPTTAQ